MDSNIFEGVIPALMTPCDTDRNPVFEGLVERAETLINAGMVSVVYCGSMGDWPLLTDEQRQSGVQHLCDAGIPVVVGTGAQNTRSAVAHAVHAQATGAGGLMLIPRVLSRGTAPAAQQAHFSAILSAAPDLPAVIYNSPYYGFETKADLFFDLQQKHTNLIGFKEFGGAAALSYAAEHITGADPNLKLLVVLPHEVLHLIVLCRAAANGDAQARSLAKELDDALMVLSKFDEGPDLVLFYKYLLTLSGENGYALHFNPDDELSASQKDLACTQLELFKVWWDNWPGTSYAL